MAGDTLPASIAIRQKDIRKARPSWRTARSQGHTRPADVTEIGIGAAGSSDKWGVDLSAAGSGCQHLRAIRQLPGGSSPLELSRQYALRPRRVALFEHSRPGVLPLD